jgi:NADH-quinone oxidoreductase subunit N
MIPVPEIILESILPALVLCGTGLVVIVVGLIVPWERVTLAAAIGIVGILIGFLASSHLRFADGTGFSGMVAMDPFAWFFNVVILIGAGLTLLISTRYLADEGLELYEYVALLLFSSAGLMFMVSGNHLLVIFIGLETLSISVYVLTAILPDSSRSKEAGIKYLILGGFSSAIFLYGMALLYGTAGSLSLPEIAAYFQKGSPTLVAKAGMAMLLIGFAFKTAAVPFHMWTPDVYDGAPTPITAFMSVGVKAAAFAAFVRVFFESLAELQVTWTHMLWVIAVLTMILGNVAAVVQQNIKRMLAYSSIAHAGYILIGMIAGGVAGTSGMLYYLLAYTFSNIGAFAVVALVGRKGEANIMLDDYRGLAKAHPALAVSMAIFLFSLAGIPPTAGFVGKFVLFGAAIDAGYYWLVIIGVLTSAAAAFYYFRVVMKMYMESPDMEPAQVQFGPAAILALVVAVVGVLYIGIRPSVYLSLAEASVKTLF